MVFDSSMFENNARVVVRRPKSPSTGRRLVCVSMKGGSFDTASVIDNRIFIY